MADAEASALRDIASRADALRQAGDLHGASQVLEDSLRDGDEPSLGDHERAALLSDLANLRIDEVSPPFAAPPRSLQLRRGGNPPGVYVEVAYACWAAQGHPEQAEAILQEAANLRGLRENTGTRMRLSWAPITSAPQG